MLLMAQQETESNFTACILANFNVILPSAININNYESHQTGLQIQSIAPILDFQEMHCRQEIYFTGLFGKD